MHISLIIYLLLLLKRLRGFEVPHRPQFHSEAEILFFKRNLKEADVILEFGSGGSTVLAASLMKRVIQYMQKEQVIGEIAYFVHPGNINREVVANAIRKYELVCD